ncbi:hypothetical protein FLK61_27550 [Paenalkalicoccus suaedae]|uniref:Uncharacterized protein n=1 Tax=Paenalkalicoccus suaedae TaxID=2592382 RepID=A0A859FCK1_9BACI|nr:hypothetical protein [Paenalkalicoccus suaedae]QKS70511.1 hypothetical protein FLK61_27550 [Paenalkalicoccus suaedae]
MNYKAKMRMFVSVQLIIIALLLAGMIYFIVNRETYDAFFVAILLLLIVLGMSIRNLTRMIAGIKESK